MDEVKGRNLFLPRSYWKKVDDIVANSDCDSLNAYIQKKIDEGNF